MLTIGIPTYRRLAYLREAVTSALAVDGMALEVVVSQDLLPTGEPDREIAAWCRSVEDRRFRHLVAPRRLGLAGNWNQLLDVAAGDHILIMGDDDRLLPECGSVLSEGLRVADVAFGDHYIIDSTGARDPAQTQATRKRFGRANMSGGLLVPAGRWVWRNAVPMLSAAIALPLARSIRFHEHLNTPELPLFARAAASGARFWYSSTCVAEYRTHASSATAGGLTMGGLALVLAEIPAPGAEDERAALLSHVADGGIRQALLDADVAMLRRIVAIPEARSRAAAVFRLASMSSATLAASAIVGTTLLRLRHGPRVACA